MLDHRRNNRSSWQHMFGISNLREVLLARQEDVLVILMSTILLAIAGAVILGGF